MPLSAPPKKNHSSSTAGMFIALGWDSGRSSTHPPNDSEGQRFVVRYIVHTRSHSTPSSNGRQRHCECAILQCIFPHQPHCVCVCVWSDRAVCLSFAVCLLCADRLTLALSGWVKENIIKLPFGIFRGRFGSIYTKPNTGAAAQWKLSGHRILLYVGQREFLFILSL